jgi:glycosyltransferase involved in cell wall biosynthesis
VPNSAGTPCGKDIIENSPDGKYGQMCKRHAREHNASQQKVRRVMIATPSYDGRLDVFYVNSLLETIRGWPYRNIELVPIFMSYDSLIQRARNDSIYMALKNDFDDMIFIDSDIAWDPKWLYKLLEYPVDVVGGTYRRKTDQDETYVCRIINNPAEVDTRTGLMKVDGLGCGFIRLSRKAMQYLWDASEPYEDRGEKRMVFEVLVDGNEIISEDIYMCSKLIRGGFPVYLDPRMCCDHLGIKKFSGNFMNWYNDFLDNLKKPSVIQV